MKNLLETPELKTATMPSSEVKVANIIGYDWSFKYENDSIKKMNAISPEKLSNDISSIIYDSTGGSSSIHAVKTQLEKLGCQILSISSPANQSTVFRIEFKSKRTD
ncbi:MAG: hypothetical protein PSX81_00675 [bacterium]|nr:hypothetical protein [bacterium]